MRTKSTAGAALLLAVLAASAHAQEAQEPLDVSRLPIDLQRIQRELRQSVTRDESENLKLRFTVDVFGQAPPLVIFGPEDNLFTGPVPYGAPSHRELVNQVTPIDYRPMAWDLNSLARWLAERAKRK